MTVSESIINWLKGYVENRVDTDIQSDSVMTFALSKAPTVNVKNYVSGREEHTEYYQFTARLDSQTNLDRIDNQSFFEGFEEWVRLQNREENFPAIENAVVSKISVSNSFYLGSTAENNSLYQLTIAIQFMKEN